LQYYTTAVLKQNQHHHFKTVTMGIHQAIKSNFLKSSVVLSAITCISFFGTAAYAQKANFSGEWKLNEAKSTLGQYAQMAPKKLKVDGQKDSLTVQRFATSPDGNETTYNEKLTFDGKETESTVFGSSKKKSVAKWADDGQSLTVNSTIVFERDGQSFEIKVVEVWKLIESGKMLSLESTSTSQMGSNTTNLFFDKAS
jgi:hypothetical protein